MEPKYLPSRGRRQFPDGRAAGGRAARQGAASRGLDRGRAAPTRRATARCSARPASTDVVTLPVEPPDRRHIFNQFVIRTPDRDGLKAHLDARRHRQRDLLPGAVPPAAVLRRPRLPARRLSARRARGRREPGDSDLRRAHAGAAGSASSTRSREFVAAARRGRAMIRGPSRSVAAPPRSARRRIPSVTTQIFIGLLLGIVVGYFWPAFGVADQAAGRRVPADDQDDHRAAAVFDARRRHRRHRRLEVDGPHRPEGDHLLRESRRRSRCSSGSRSSTSSSRAPAWRCRSAPTRARPRRWRRTSSTRWDIFLHLFPTSVVDAMARGDILQLVVFSTFFGVALAAIGDEGASRCSTCSRAPRT